MQDNKILGIDVGASGMKGAIVDVTTGKLATDRQRVETPKPATPEAMAKAFAKLVQLQNYSGVVGCGFPSVVKKGVALTAANIDKSWIGVNIEEIFSEACGCPVYATNDADAAGMAEMGFGAGKDQSGTVLLITLGSGIGTALFLDGKLAPNTEFGHIIFHNHQIAERYAASSVKDKEGLSWTEWGGRINEYLLYIERILSPDLIIIGGGISRDFENYKHLITTEARVTPAKALNAAGTVGAALYANVHQHIIKSPA